jgi:hypothetical protein
LPKISRSRANTPASNWVWTGYILVYYQSTVLVPAWKAEIARMGCEHVHCFQPPPSPYKHRPSRAQTTAACTMAWRVQKPQLNLSSVEVNKGVESSFSPPLNRCSVRRHSPQPGGFVSNRSSRWIFTIFRATCRSRVDLDLTPPSPRYFPKGSTNRGMISNFCHNFFNFFFFSKFMSKVAESERSADLIWCCGPCCTQWVTVLGKIFSHGCAN